MGTRVQSKQRLDTSSPKPRTSTRVQRKETSSPKVQGLDTSSPKLRTSTRIQSKETSSPKPIKDDEENELKNAKKKALKTNRKQFLENKSDLKKRQDKLIE